MSFSRMPKRRLHVCVNTVEVREEGLVEDEHMEVNIGIEVSIKF